MKKVLMLASVASMIDQFNLPNIKLLLEMGYLVEVACNFLKGSTYSIEKNEGLKSTLTKMNVKYYQIDFARDIKNISSNLKALKQVEELLRKKDYEFIHCHSPIGGVAGRIAGKRTQTKVIYTAHGFHFFKGASILSWLLFYPVEKICAHMTDILICINSEDYTLAQKKMKAKKVVYVPGIGIDFNQFVETFDREKKRKALGVLPETILLTSVGELNDNKNHAAAIKALSLLQKEMNIKHIKYLICGQGEKKLELESLIKSSGLESQIMLLGFRTDVPEILKASDVFVFPSYREGLSVALMEAMCCGLPVVCSSIRGNTDLIDNNGGKLFQPDNLQEMKKALNSILLCTNLERADLGKKNQIFISKFSLNSVIEKMRKIYVDVLL